MLAEIDLIFVEGVAAVFAAVTVFLGSTFLLMALVMGARLAYWVTASVTLGFLFIMTLVWSYGTPLGPVGQLPDWEPVAFAEDPASTEFGPAASFPEGEWRAPDEENQEDLTKAGELESAAIDFVGAVVQGEVGKTAGTVVEAADQDFLADTDAAVVKDSTRLLTQGDEQYGALELEASQAAIDKADEADPDQQFTPKDAKAFVVMKYDPGNPLGKARTIAAGTFLVFV
ncbi:MAG: hypothetical protein ACRDI3_02590, partial [Actinomycetota bacterium]